MYIVYSNSILNVVMLQIMHTADYTCQYTEVNALVKDTDLHQALV